MPRFPHHLRREGMFTHGWSLKGTVLSGRYEPPRGDRPGVYQSATLRLEYRHGERRQGLRFQSPFLSRDGDRIEGQVRLGRTNRWVRLTSRGTGTEGVTMQVVRTGMFRRKDLLMAPDGVPVAVVSRKGAHFDVDIPAATFAPPEKGKRGGAGKARLFEAGIAMLLAAKIDQEVRRRTAMAGAAAGAAGAAAAGATARAVHNRRKDQDGPQP